MAENDFGSTPTQADLTQWANTYGITTPVLADVGWAQFDALWDQNYTPANMLLAPGMTVVKADWVQESDIEAVLPL